MEAWSIICLSRHDYLVTFSHLEGTIQWGKVEYHGIFQIGILAFNVAYLRLWIKGMCSRMHQEIVRLVKVFGTDSGNFTVQLLTKFKNEIYVL